MKISVFCYSKYHGKAEPGSTRLRVRQLQKYWPEYQDYKFGENPEVMVYQKVYIQEDWRLMEHARWIQILDICDPDWMEGASIRETLDYMDGITCPTETMAEFLRQMTDKPVKVIPDRHDLELFPELKTHKGETKTAVWFGYRQNAELLQYVLPALTKRGIKTTVITNDNPYFNNSGDYIFKKFDESTIYQDLQNYDVCVLPQGTRPQDRFKSNNKTVIAQLCGLPVVTNTDELDAMQSAKARNKEALACYDKAIKEYDCRLSVQDMKDFIQELKK